MTVYFAWGHGYTWPAALSDLDARRTDRARDFSPKGELRAWDWAVEVRGSGRSGLVDLFDWLHTCGLIGGWGREPTAAPLNAKVYHIFTSDHGENPALESFTEEDFRAHTANGGFTESDLIIKGEIEIVKIERVQTVAFRTKAVKP